MSAPANQLAELERAIMARAEELAQEFTDKAQRQRDIILRDAAERLHLAEEREVLIAKAEAERHYRRVTQASELQLQSRLDQLRWEMVKTIESRLVERMQGFREDRAAYRAWLITLLIDSAALLPDGRLVVEAGADDLAWLGAEWDALVSAAAPEREISLAEQPVDGHGGLLIRTEDNSAQVDNRFEGRLTRLAAETQRMILRYLFPTDMNASARSGGPQ
jgi:V/A-type H+-transporting ATPase subunit E